MPVIQQEHGVQTVKGLPTRWGRRAYRELKAEMVRGHEAAEPATVPYLCGPLLFVGPLVRVPSRYDRLCAILDQVTTAPLPVDATDAQLCVLAERYASDCAAAAVIETSAAPVGIAPMEGGPRQMGARAGLSPRERMANICAVRGIDAPKCLSDAEAVARCTDPAWWRRNLRRVHGRTFEAAAIRLGFVSIKAGAYASDETVARRLAQVTRNKAALEAVTIRNETGYECTLGEAAQKTTSNKRIRRGELMLRLAGCEEIALENKHVGVFFTLTAPSKYHAVLAKTGTTNPNYANATPRAVQSYLQRTWACIRTAYGRHDIKPYGFRIAEPHHDGCVHWHGLLFMPAYKVRRFCRIMERYALAEDGDEPGARSNRVKFERIDSSKGSAAAYIAKYISKNIDDDSEDAHDEVLDEQGNVVKLAITNDRVRKASQRVDAWAGVWGIRQFQPIGQPPVTVWREMRRVPEGAVKDAPAHVRAAWEAAQRVEETDADGVVSLVRAANYANYIRAQGGVCMGRDYVIAIAQEPARIEGRYGVRDGMAPVGVFAKAAPLDVYASIRYTWERVPTGVAVGSPWSPVNKCTGLSSYDPFWSPDAQPEPVADFDDAWFDSDEYRQILVEPIQAADEWLAAEVAAAETKARTVWTVPSYAHRRGYQHG